MTASLVELTEVHLAYRLSRSSAGSLKEYAIHLFKRQVQYEQFWALRGVTLSVEPGKVLAVIGHNGAGKSTLLKLIARVLPPTRGRVVVRGRLAPMIELGAGFNLELTGYENILLYGTLLGRSATQMRDRAAAIAEWADLPHHLDVPLRSYSSGMLARLAFSVAVDVEPDVLLVDEVLSVGDEFFQQRLSDRIAELITGGTAVVLVTHNLGQVLARADRVIWMEHGSIIADGDPQSVVAAYREKSAAQSDKAARAANDVAADTGGGAS